MNDAELRRAIMVARLRDIPLSLFEKIERERHRSPRFAHALARVVYEIARRKKNPALRARAELALIQTLNTLGEFPDVLARCEKTAARFEKLGDAENQARVWLEAASAETWRGNLDLARTYLVRAKNLSDAPEISFQVMWIQGGIAWQGSDFNRASELFELLLSRVDKGDHLMRALALREFGHVRHRFNPHEGLGLLRKARRQLVRLHCAADIAFCDYWLAQALSDLNRFAEGEKALQRAKRFAAREGMRFIAALCDLDLGYLRWGQQRFHKALTFTQAARPLFAQIGVSQEVATCDLNSGSYLLSLNRYDEAIPYLEQAAEAALDTQRYTKAGVAHANLGELYDALGDYPRALHHQLTASKLFAPQRPLARLARTMLELGKTYFHLGQIAQARQALRRARAFSLEGHLPSETAQADLGLAQIALASAQSKHARAALLRARAQLAKLEQTIYVAYCERLLAQTNVRHRATAMRHLAASRNLFARQNLFVEVALCELTSGDLHCAWQEWDAAERAYQSAQKTLQAAFPDHAWRIAYGLGKIARARGDETAALQEWLRGCERIAKLRAGSGIELLSNDLFHARQHIFTDALELAHTLERNEDALRVMEIAKAQTFLQQVMGRAPRALLAVSPATANLLERERVLRDRLVQQRKQLVFDAHQTQPTAPLATRGVPFKMLDKLKTTLREYEEVAQQLQLARHGLEGNPTLALFDVETFRAYANARWGDAWTALDYFFANGKLYIACIEPTRVSITTTRWTPSDAAQLKLATSTHPDEREVVYNETLRGFPVNTRANVLEDLTPRLIPASVRQGRAQTLIVSPHHALHQLPFHALCEKNAPLLERFTFVYTPNLQALVELARNHPAKPKHSRMLVCGAETFSDAPPLLHTRAEVQALQQLPNTTVLWQEDATRATLLEWNARDALSRYSILHFATHARVDADAPYESHIALTNDTLNVLDIPELKLDARLVTLSACASAIGKGGSGDEWLGLTRAFFSASARAVVASLWNVDDASTAQLMELFYKNLEGGKAIADALRDAQRVLYRQGYSAHHWAAFVAMGEV